MASRVTKNDKLIKFGNSKYFKTAFRKKMVPPVQPFPYNNSFTIVVFWQKLFALNEPYIPKICLSHQSSFVLYRTR